MAERVEIARARLAFYVSTPAYRRPFANAGLEGLALQMSALSKHGRWQEMRALVNDDVLRAWVGVARYEELARAITERYRDILDRIEVSIPVTDEGDREILRAVISDLREI